MSKYTIKLGDLLKQLYINEIMTPQEMADYNINSLNKTPYEIIAETKGKVFNFTYPIPTLHKDDLEKKFLAHYYNWEIGTETPAHFLFLLHNEMLEIMPYYNKLYIASDIEYEPYNLLDLHEVIHGAGSNNAQNTSNNSLTSNTTDTESNSYEDEIKESDTPQGRLDDIKEGRYMSRYNDNEGSESRRKTNNLISTNNLSNNATGNYNDNRTRDVVGTDGRKSKSELLLEYAKAIQNVDLQIIMKLQPLFMQVF